MEEGKKEENGLINQMLPQTKVAQSQCKIFLLFQGGKEPAALGPGSAQGTRGNEAQHCLLASGSSPSRGKSLPGHSASLSSGPFPLPLQARGTQETTSRPVSCGLPPPFCPISALDRLSYKPPRQGDAGGQRSRH